MKKIILLGVYFIALVINAVAQVQLNKTEFDLGDISLLNEDIIDLHLENLTNNAIYVLRIETPRDVSLKFSSKNIASGNTEKLRVKLNPQKKGKIKRIVKVHLSTNTEPINITVSANVKEIPKNNRQACPDFGKRITPPGSQQQTIAEIKEEDLILFDQSTDKELLAVTTVNDETFTPSDPEVIKQTPVAPEAPQPPKVVKPKKVRKSPEERRESPSLGTILFGNQKDKSIKEEKDIEKETTIEEETIIDKKIEQTEQADNLLDDHYKPNNIIFLIDASTSMREDEKMDLLKEAMIQLLEPLRSIDYLSIVTYSGDAQLVLPPTSAVEKDKIAQTINNIHADGSTQAVKGIKKAIQVGKSNFIEEGNNQIILATDGAFDIGGGNESLRRKIQSNAKNGLAISVIGIKNAKWTNKSLKEIVELGDGHLIKLANKRDASKLLDEVKEMSLY